MLTLFGALIASGLLFSFTPVSAGVYHGGMMIVAAPSNYLTDDNGVILTDDNGVRLLAQ